MAVDAYIQAAAAQLESAATALKQEAEQIRAEFMTYDRQVAHDITTKDAERKMYSARAATAPNGEQSAHLLFEANRLKGEIDRLKQNLEQRRSQVTQVVKGKQSQVDGLMSEARSLYGKAASMK